MSQLDQPARFDKDRQANLVGRLYQAAAGAPDWVELVDIWSAFYFPVIADAPSEQLAGPGDIGAWSEGELNRHFKQAVGLLRPDETDGSSSALNRLDQFPFAVALTDASGAISLLNAAARQSFGEDCIGEPLDRFVTRTMSATDPRSPALSAGLRNSATQTLHFADFTLGSIEAPAILLDRADISQHEDHELSPLHRALLRLFDADDAIKRAAVVLAVQLDEVSAQQLRKIYHLTKSELQLVRELVDGKSVQMVSEERSKSPTTLRNQLQSIYSKTGTNRQPQLVALVCSQIFVSNLGRTFLLDDSAGETEPSGPQLWRSYARNAVRSSIMEMPDKRNLQVLQHGDPLGEPCLIFHPTVLPPYLTESAITSSKALGLRCVAPVRPGFGASTPVKFTPAILDEFAHDLSNVLDQLGIAEAPIISSGLGTVWAFRFAELYTGRVTRMEIGTVPVAPGRLHAKRNLNALAPHRRVSLFNPVVLPLVTRIQLHHFSRADRSERKRGLQRIYFSPDADLEVLEDDAILDWALSWASPEGARSQKGIINDLRVQDETPWADHAKRVMVPVHFWHGSANTLNPLDLVHELAGEMANTEITVIEGAGELFFYQIFSRVLTALKRSAGGY